MTKLEAVTFVRSLIVNSQAWLTSIGVDITNQTNNEYDVLILKCGRPNIPNNDVVVTADKYVEANFNGTTTGELRYWLEHSQYSIDYLKLSHLQNDDAKQYLYKSNFVHDEYPGVDNSTDYTAYYPDSKRVTYGAATCQAIDDKIRLPIITHDPSYVGSIEYYDFGSTSMRVPIAYPTDTNSAPTDRASVPADFVAMMSFLVGEYGHFQANNEAAHGDVIVFNLNYFTYILNRNLASLDSELTVL